MNGREAVKALMDGKTVTHPYLPSRRFRLFKSEVLILLPGDDIGYPWCGGLEGVVGRDGWSIVETPLTDEQLIAEWEREAGRTTYSLDALQAFSQCASQLRERKL